MAMISLALSYYSEFLTLFKKNVINYPNQVAIQYQSQSLTYADLDTRSTLLAGYLQSLGVNKNHIVGILLPHGLELSIGLVGILKSGAAYLPLDPDYPSARIRFMIDDASPSIIITSRNLVDTISDSDCDSVVKIVLIEDEFLNYQYVPVYFEQDDLAYLIYTSGSTGQPKGVMVTHHNLYHFLSTIQEHIQLKSTDRFFSITPISFDIFALEFFLPLTQGAACILNDAMTRKDPLLLQQQLALSAATFFQATPASYAMLIQSGWKNEYLRGLLCGGEAWDETLAKKIFACVGEKTQLWNMYGPTEATIWCACQEITPETTEILIGPPLSGNEFYLINENNENSDEGELLIAGLNVAAGYFNRPDIQDKFISNTNKTHERSYRTGDWVKRIGTAYRYMSRIDRQIKLRGFRVELSEIEAKINAYPGVVQSVVIVNDKMLAAFIMTMKPIEQDDIQSYLQKYLPAYMLPNYFWFLQQWPLTPAGKIDYKQLEKLFSSKKEKIIKVTEKTLSSFQQQLKAIWVELLKTESITGKSHFFNAGGHSLLAVRLASRIRQVFGANVSLQEIFQTPIFDDMASLIENRNNINNNNIIISPPILSKLPIINEYSLTPEQQDNWDYQFKLGGVLAVNSPSVIQLEGPLNVSLLEKSINLVLNSYSVFHYQFLKKGTAVVQKKTITDINVFKWKLNLKNNSLKNKKSIQKFIFDNEQEGFLVEKAPLFRASIVEVDHHQYILITNNHHLIMDGWAKSIFFKKIGFCYQQLMRDPTFVLEKNTQYEDYLNWYFAWQDSDQSHEQQQFWRQFLKNGIQAAYLDNQYYDHVKNNNKDETDFSGSVEYFLISLLQKKQIEQFAIDKNVTVFAVFLSCFYLTLASFNRASYQLIGTVASARTETQFEEVVGLLANTLLIPADLTVGSLTVFIEQIHHHCLMALTHQALPFSKILASTGVSA
jgi:amino acid adenylation domain-containing protein